jgi:7-cyano-7-deazaguanine synthase
MLPPNPDAMTVQMVRAMLRDIIVRAEERGRDSWGWAAVTTERRMRHGRFHGPPSKARRGDFESMVDGDTTVVINNNRAEPTTEYVADKTVADIQPFVHRGWAVAHNGTIANDRDLAKRYEMDLDTRVDSAVLPRLMERWSGSHMRFDALVSGLRSDVVGSYALAAVDRYSPSELFLAANYKPLYVAMSRKPSFFLFTSLESYLGGLGWRGHLTSTIRIAQVPAYTALRVRQNPNGLGFEIEEASLRRTPDPASRSGRTTDPKRVLVVCSGGLDSVTVAAQAVRQGKQVTLLHFLYRCRAEEREVAAVKAVAERLGCEYLLVDTDIFKRVIGGSPLTRTGDKVADGEAGAEFAHEWVPARNLIMLSIAVGIAESKGYGTILLGNNLEEAGAYPDNEMIFIDKLREVLPYATQVDRHVDIEMPVGNLMKHEIVRLGLDIGAPLDLTWSCYEGGEKHCGKCGPCFMRRTAFKMNDEPEVIEYEGGDNG